MSKYADVIIDLNSEALDRVFCYQIPQALSDQIYPGCQVQIPFGRSNTMRTGYVIALRDHSDYDPEKIKPLAGLVPKAVGIEQDLISLAVWMRDKYGSTLNQALKTVLPVKARIHPVMRRTIRIKASDQEAAAALEESRRKKHKAKARLLEALLSDREIPMEVASGRLNLSSGTIQSLVKAGIIELTEQRQYRSSMAAHRQTGERKILSGEQSEAVQGILKGYQEGDLRPCLIHGVTGSGKTEVYMDVMEAVIRQGKQVIMLIPEISLTYQTVMRFYRRFGDRVSVVNSRLSAGERYDQFLRASRGEVDIMIGPRSALFTPFPNLGLIVIDEEHDGAYKSELSPKYHAVETAIQRAKQSGGLVVLGSATPSVDSFYAASIGLYRLFSLKHRAVPGSVLPQVTIRDLREELKSGNKTIFSRELQEEMQRCLERGEQTMLFLNRRGYSGFVSCRSCGEAFTCPHCDVSLTAHRDGSLVCHYCGYRIPMPRQCPHCGSPYIAGFGLGTQKVEAMTEQMFPGIRTLRMDYDTTAKKGGHQAILQAFAEGEADVLIGTQMIVKGHDFPNVTLMGILAADLSLHSEDYHASERTFQLLTQAAGRAGRGERAGKVIIQTYNPEHYAIVTASMQDYQAFFQKELEYRRLMQYPPMGLMMDVLLTSPDQELLERQIRELADGVKQLPPAKSGKLLLIGPGIPSVGRIKDLYRRHFICKASEERDLAQVRHWLEGISLPREIRIQFDNL